MLSQVILTIILAVPLITLIIITLKSGYWSDYKKSRGVEIKGYNAKYNLFFFYFLIVGVIFMWISWIGGFILLLTGQYYIIFDFIILTNQFSEIIQVFGVLFFLIGSMSYNLTLFYAGRYLRPAPSGTLVDHKLIKNGPYKIIRHPLYVAYVLILFGLCLLLHMFYLLIPTLFLLIGIYPSAQAEEEVLLTQFGSEYQQYQKNVGRFFPKLFIQAKKKAEEG